jgi:hypothetical protein
LQLLNDYDPLLHDCPEIGFFSHGHKSLAVQNNLINGIHEVTLDEISKQTQEECYIAFIGREF